MSYIDWIGGIGVGLILGAYFLSLLKKLSLDGFLYLFLNFIGATLACTASILIQYWPFIILEGAWALVSLVAILRKVIIGNNRNTRI